MSAEFVVVIPFSASAVAFAVPVLVVPAVPVVPPVAVETS